MTSYVFISALRNVVARIDSDGKSRFSCLTSNPEYLDWVSAGNTTAPYVPSPEQVVADALYAADIAAVEAAKAEQVVRYLATYTPAECEAYVQANVTTLAQAKDMLAKFAMALSVLTRKELR